MWLRPIGKKLLATVCGVSSRGTTFLAYFISIIQGFKSRAYPHSALRGAFKTQHVNNDQCRTNQDHLLFIVQEPVNMINVQNVYVL